MSDFQSAMAFVFQNEGVTEEKTGLVHEKEDNGGLTNYGLSMAFLKKANPSITEDEVISMTRFEAMDYYQKYFWIKCLCDKIESQRISTYYFDCCVNHGGNQACLLLQRALMAIGEVYNDSIHVDGIIGEQTLSCVHKATTVDGKEDALISALKVERAYLYKKITRLDPTQAVFLVGWLKRAYRG